MNLKYVINLVKKVAELKWKTIVHLFFCNVILEFYLLYFVDIQN